MEISKSQNGRKFQNYIILLTLIIFLFCLLYTYFSRSLSSFLYYSLNISLVIAAFYFLLALFLVTLYGWKKPDKKIKFTVLVVLSAVLLSGFIYYSVAVSIKDFYYWLISPKLTNSQRVSYTIFITLISGLLLFYFRLKLRSFYGITEAIVGLLVAVNRALTETPETIATSNYFIAILTASIYLFVRGLDNIHQGLFKEPVDPLAAKILSMFTRKKVRKKIILNDY